MVVRASFSTTLGLDLLADLGSACDRGECDSGAQGQKGRSRRKCGMCTMRECSQPLFWLPPGVGCDQESQGSSPYAFCIGLLMPVMACSVQASLSLRNAKQSQLVGPPKKFKGGIP